MLARLAGLLDFGRRPVVVVDPTGRPAVALADLDSPLTTGDRTESVADLVLADREPAALRRDGQMAGGDGR